MTDINAPHFHDAEAARKYLEAIRWPEGPVCPHCGAVGGAYELKGKAGKYRCAEKECRKDFSVTVGTVFERSHISLEKWLFASCLLMASKKGISAHQMHRMLGVTYKTAWFMMHRLREALTETNPGPLGGSGKTVEADETYIGKKAEPTSSGKRGPANKRAVVSLVERGGRTRTFHVDRATKETVREILIRNVAKETDLVTDESRLYTQVGKEFNSHKRSHHSKGTYVKKDGTHSNTVENYFSIFKRGMKGIYQHCGERHLQRYLTEFDFRYSNRSATDAERNVLALRGIEGKRLTYRRTCVA